MLKLHIFIEQKTIFVKLNQKLLTTTKISQQQKVCKL